MWDLRKKNKVDWEQSVVKKRSNLKSTTKARLGWCYRRASGTLNLKQLSKGKLNATKAGQGDL